MNSVSLEYHESIEIEIKFLVESIFQKFLWERDIKMEMSAKYFIYLDAIWYRRIYIAIGIYEDAISDLGIFMKRIEEG